MSPQVGTQIVRWNYFMTTWNEQLEQFLYDCDFTTVSWPVGLRRADLVTSRLDQASQCQTPNSNVFSIVRVYGINDSSDQKCFPSFIKYVNYLVQVFILSFFFQSSILYALFPLNHNIRCIKYCVMLCHLYSSMYIQFTSELYDYLLMFKKRRCATEDKTRQAATHLFVVTLEMNA